MRSTPNGMKWCNACSSFKSLEDFYKNKSKSDGLHTQCISCKKESNSRWYINTTKEYKNSVVAANLIRKTNTQENICEYLSDHPCVDCDEEDIVVLEFDHLGDKFWNIGSMIASGYSWKAVKEEIEKCEVVCANCHKRRTASRIGSYRHAYNS